MSRGAEVQRGYDALSERRCKNCVFWQGRYREVGSDQMLVGDCRIGPPTLIAAKPAVNLETGLEDEPSRTRTKWPLTMRTDWCGKFSPKRDEAP